MIPRGSSYHYCTTSFKVSGSAQSRSALVYDKQLTRLANLIRLLENKTMEMFSLEEETEANTNSVERKSAKL